jgi:hypothetical protein
MKVPMATVMRAVSIARTAHYIYTLNSMPITFILIIKTPPGREPGKMKDFKLDYWKEAVSSAFDEHSLKYPDDIIESIAKDMINSAECQSQAFGHDCIPSPAKSEKSAQVKNLEGRIKELEQEIQYYRQSVATRRGVPIEQVHVDVHGTVIYGRA